MSQKKNQRTARQHTPALPLTPWQIGVLMGVVALIVVVLWAKGRPAESEAATAVTPEAGVMVEATPPADLAPRAGESSEAHLDRMMAEGQPTLAFFHSTSCYQCTEMIKIVDEVYPDFANEIALVRVNVYDAANRSLLQRAGIQVIPTLIFINSGGQGSGTTGVMSAEQLRETFTALLAGETP